MPDDDLTESQAALLQTIQQFLKAKRYPPAQRQLARIMGKQLRSIQEVLERLERKGYVKYDRGVTRSLRVTRRLRPCPPALTGPNGNGQIPQTPEPREPVTPLGSLP